MDPDLVEKLALRIVDLEGRLKSFAAFAIAHEKLEADMVTDGASWMDEFLEQFQDEFEAVQRLRNEAMSI